MLHEEDTKFAGHMIQALSTILLTSTELFELRTQLKDLKTKVINTNYSNYCGSTERDVILSVNLIGNIIGVSPCWPSKANHGKDSFVY